MFLEVEFEEMPNERYTNNFKHHLLYAYERSLSQDQEVVLAEVIEQARLSGLSPQELAGNLAENWKEIFPDV